MENPTPSASPQEVISSESTSTGQMKGHPTRGLTSSEDDIVIRRPSSIRFVTRLSDSGVPSGKPKPTAPPNRRQRMSSPPPPRNFQPRVSFDTFDNKDARDFSLTLNCKHSDYQYTRRSRTFLCGTDQNDYSEFALEWLIDELADDGDEIVCLRVVDKDSKINSEASVEEGRYRREAQNLLEQIIDKDSDEKALSLTLEFAVGKVHETIQRMIRIYEPAILVVGTRGRSLGGIQGLLPGSVSKYCLQHSPVPVIVVRPTSKREKKKRKRQANPSRRGYRDILQRTGAETAHVLTGSSRNSMTEDMLVPPELEAEAVAAAIGLPPELYSPSHHGPSSRSDRARSTDNSQPTSPGPTSPTEEDDDPLGRSAAIMKSPPNLPHLDSPLLLTVLGDSDASDEADDDEPQPCSSVVVDAPLHHHPFTLPDRYPPSYPPTDPDPITDSPRPEE